MKRSGVHAIGIAGAMALAALPSVASAQECVAQADVRDGVIYAMPLLVDSFASKCGDSLAEDGFLATEGKAFKARFAEQQQAAWPGAFRLLGEFADRGRAPGGNKNDGFAETFRSLPEDAVRPFFEAFVVQEVTQAIPVKECATIERGLSLIAPLPVENLGELMTFLFDVSGVKNPRLCPYAPE